MNDLVDDVRVEGEVLLDGEDIYAPSMDVAELRSRVGMVFQKPNPFPKPIFDNVAYGPRLQGVPESRMGELVEESLSAAGLWGEVKDKLREVATKLSGGQQQRLCIARAIAVEPEVILMDEPCSALDPIATAKVEELMFKLKEKYTIAIVTHSMQQAARTSSQVAFFHLGKLIEFGETKQVFELPVEKLTQDYITGRIG